MVDLDGMNGVSGLKQPTGQSSESGPDLNHRKPLRQVGHFNRFPDYVAVDQEILTELLLGLVADVA